VNVMGSMRTVGQALLAVSIAIALPAASKGYGALISGSYRNIPAASDSGGEDLLFSNGGALAFLRNHTPGDGHVDTLRLETDDCGMPASFANGRATLRKSAFADDADDFDDFDEDDPVLLAQTQISRWLSTHPEIAVVSDGLDKWCGDSSFDGGGIPPESIADWQFKNNQGLPVRTQEIAYLT
jgi:hypothetical protein